MLSLQFKKFERRITKFMKIIIFLIILDLGFLIIGMLKEDKPPSPARVFCPEPEKIGPVLEPILNKIFEQLTMCYESTPWMND